MIGSALIAASLGELPDNEEAEPRLAPASCSAKDVIKSTLPPNENHELAEELLARFPVDRAQLLKDMVGLCFYWMRWGNKREERAACDFLNELQRIAIRNAGKSPNNKLRHGGENQ